MQFKAKLFASLSTLAALLAASGARANALPELKVGAIFSLSGAQSTFGEESSQGMELALARLSATDPDLARRISVFREDDKSNPVDATAAAKRLLGVNKVDVMFTSGSSSHTLSMLGTVQEAGKPLVAASSTSPEITQKADFVFRTCFSDPFQGAIIANFALKHLGKKKAAILMDHKSDYSKGFAQYFEKNFTAGGGTIVAKESYEAGKKDFKTQLTKVRVKSPEILVIPGYYEEAGLIMKQAKQIGYNVIMLGGDGWDSPNLFQLAGANAVQGHFFSTHFSADDKDPDVQAFVTAYHQKYKKAPGALAALSYDGVLVLANAFKRAASNKPEDLKKALASTKGLKGVTGTISINASHDAEKDAVILKTEAGKASFATKISLGSH